MLDIDCDASSPPSRGRGELGPSLLQQRFSRSLAARVVALTIAAASTFSAAAQPSGTPPSDPTVQVARERYHDGVTAFDAGKFDDARMAFQQAYELTKKPAILLNLGVSETKSNHPAEGGNHLLQFLREYKQAKPEEIASANEALEDVRKRVGQIAISVNLSGADLTIDGVAVGRSPIPEALFAEPGGRTITAAFNGATTSTRVEVRRGEVASASLAMPGTSPTVTPIGPEPTRPINPEPVPSIAGGPGAHPAQPPIGPTPPLWPPQAVGQQTPNPPTGGDESESFGHWYGHKPLAWVGTGLAAVGLGLGIGLSAAAGSSASTANSAASQIREHAASQGITAPCSESGTNDYPGYQTACSALRSASSTHGTDVAVAAVGWVTFAVAGGGTVVYALVDWSPKKSHDTGSSGDRGPFGSVTVVPIIAPGYAGVRGQF